MRKLILLVLIFLTGCKAEVQVTEEPVQKKLTRSDIAGETGKVISLLSNHKSGEHEFFQTWAEMSPQGCSAIAQHHDAENRTSEIDMVCEGHRYFINVEYDEDLKITDMEYTERKAPPALSETQEYTEQLVFVGKDPGLYGILTIPAEDDHAPVAILIPDGFESDVNASGDDPVFRQELAHLLASRGIASLRYEMRRCEEEAETMTEIYWQDFASAVHMLERYPVNAGSLIYIGHGLGGTIAYASVYNHFEITGGIILLDPEYDNTLYLVPGIDVPSVSQILQEKDPPETIDGVSTALLREYEQLNTYHYLNLVKNRTLVIAGRDSEDFPSWQKFFRKYTNVMTKSYMGIDHQMRRINGELYPIIVRDMVNWLYGTNINSVNYRG